MAYIKNIDKDEIRSGFLVTTDRKKLWDKELELLLEFDRICKKHKITYVLGGGTLLGAIRHKGFIPWDDDIDVYLSRPDFMRLKEIVPKEISYPYSYEMLDNNRMLDGKHNLIDTTTTAYHIRAELKGQAIGVFIDIFAMEVGLAPNVTYPPEIETLPIVIKDLLLLAIDDNYSEHRAYFNPILTEETIREIEAKPFEERFQVFEQFCLAHYDATDYVQDIALNDGTGRRRRGVFSKEEFFTTVDVEFEGYKFPAPIAYEKVLIENFGDWRKEVRCAANHEGVFIFSTDIPYREFLEKVSD